MNIMSPLAEWKAHLLADGKAAVLELLDGTACLGPLSAAEPYDAVDAILGRRDIEAGLSTHSTKDACRSLASTAIRPCWKPVRNTGPICWTSTCF